MKTEIEANKKGAKSKVVHLNAFAYDENSQNIIIMKGMPHYCSHEEQITWNRK